MLHNMSTTEKDNSKDSVVITNICANCGKEGGDVTNTCNKCKMVKYCNAACKKKHRSKHKKACDRRITELHDEELFAIPPKEDCQICFMRIPILRTGRKRHTCCGKMICSGCVHAVRMRDGDGICPFCRAPASTSDEEVITRTKRRADDCDAEAIYSLGVYYSNGEYGFTQNHAKAFELWNRAAELGSTDAYYNIGCVYLRGTGVEVDKKKANHFWELAAMRGVCQARFNLGVHEFKKGNVKRAIKHYMIAAESDYNALEAIQTLHHFGKATKEEYSQALRSYQAYLGEIKSRQRDEAAAFSDI